ncbi:chlamydia polymorphic membrane middle domain protein, partial [Chlamydia suis MD56]
FLL